MSKNKMKNAAASPRALEELSDSALESVSGGRFAGTPPGFAAIERRPGPFAPGSGHLSLGPGPATSHFAPGCGHGGDGGSHEPQLPHVGPLGPHVPYGPLHLPQFSPGGGAGPMMQRANPGPHCGGPVGGGMPGPCFPNRGEGGDSE